MGVHRMGNRRNYLRVRGEYPGNAKNSPYLTNYLRVRGEYSPATSPAHCSAELPPRARRIPEPSATSSTPAGTTSACAENTHDGHGRVPCKWNYLRVRGEYHCLGFLGGLTRNYLRVRGEYGTYY